MAVHVLGNPPPEPVFPQRVRELVQLCSQQGFPGILADWPEEVSPALARFTGLLGVELAQNGKALVLPLQWQDTCPTAQLLVSSSICGGTLRGRLTDLSRRFGRERLVVQLQRSCAVFSLPSPTGQGMTVEPSALARLQNSQHPRVYFSSALCAQYVSWQEGNTPKLLLFDDAQSLRAKLALVGELGIPTCVAAYPEVRALLPQLLGGSTL
jgi:hypothetical protein